MLTSFCNFIGIWLTYPEVELGIQLAYANWDKVIGMKYMFECEIVDE